MKHLEREHHPTLWRKVFNSVFEKTGTLISEQPRFERFTLCYYARGVQIPYCIGLRDAIVPTVICSEVTGDGIQECLGRFRALRAFVSSEKRLLHDFIGRVARRHELPNVSAQPGLALGEEPREEVSTRVGHRSLKPSGRSKYRTPRGVHWQLFKVNWGFFSP